MAHSDGAMWHTPLVPYGHRDPRRLLPWRHKVTAGGWGWGCVFRFWESCRVPEESCLVLTYLLTEHQGVHTSDAMPQTTAQPYTYHTYHDDEAQKQPNGNYGYHTQQNHKSI